MTLPARFWAKVEIHVDGCWLWTAGTSFGYGKFNVGDRMQQAHRVAYMALVGPIPEGLEPDHLCRNRNCVRPDHLELVTRRVNALRGTGWAARNAAKTHCPQGHPFDEANTYWTNLVGRAPHRRCRFCSLARSAKRRVAKRASLALVASLSDADRRVA